MPPELPNGTELAPGVFAPDGSLRLQAARAQGPGGQNVNKVNTRMELWLDLRQIVGLRETAIARLAHLAGKRLTQDGLLHLSASEHRSQESNRQALFDRLRLMIQTARVEPKIRRKTKPSYGSKQRRLEQKNRRGEIKSQRRSLDHWFFYASQAAILFVVVFEIVVVIIVIEIVVGLFEVIVVFVVVFILILIVVVFVLIVFVEIVLVLFFIEVGLFFVLVFDFLVLFFFVLVVLILVFIVIGTLSRLLGGGRREQVECFVVERLGDRRAGGRCEDGRVQIAGEFQVECIRHDFLP